MAFDDRFEIRKGPGRPRNDVELRHPLAPGSQVVTRSDSSSWWMAWPRDGFTARCQQHRERMSSDVIGRKVPDQIDGVYVGLNRPQK
jgi:hypothetical protein